MKNIKIVIAALLASIASSGAIADVAQKCGTAAADSECVRLGRVEKATEAGDTRSVQYRWQADVPSRVDARTYVKTEREFAKSGESTEIHTAVINLEVPTLVMVYGAFNYSGSENNSDYCSGFLEIHVNGKRIKNGGMEDDNRQPGGDRRACLADGDVGTLNTFSELVSLPAGTNTIRFGARTTMTGNHGYMFSKVIRIVSMD